MAAPVVSILISSHNRLSLFRRVLWAIANRGPQLPFEVVIADDDSTEDILGEVKLYSSRFAWTFIRLDPQEFERQTGLKKFHNNPAWSSNVAFRHSRGRYVFLQGNEVIPVGDAYDRMLAELPAGGLLFSTTYDLPGQYLNALDAYGANLSLGLVRACERWPLHSDDYRSDVTNYLSLCERSVWEGIGGYDERYYAGISAEDSDFVRRVRAMGVRTAISQAVSLHQSHGGKTRYYEPTDEALRARWEEGCRINHRLYHAWQEGVYQNQQTWEWGKLGIKEIISSPC